LALVRPFRGSGWSLFSILKQPVLLWVVVEWIYHLWHKFVLFCDLQHGSGVLVAATVIRRREKREQLTTSESFEAIHHALMGPDDELTSVRVEEVLDSIGTELYDVSCAVRVSDEIRLDA
jgi:hypothetical protein